MKYSGLVSRYNMEEENIHSLKDFIDGRFHLYYFKNFLDITDGDLDDSKKLYKLDTALSNILSKFILKLELRMKHELLINIEYENDNVDFWSKRDYYRKNALEKITHNDETIFDSLVKNITKDLRNMNFSGKVTNSKVLYSISFGKFYNLFNHLKDEYKGEFISKFSNNTGYKNVKNYLLSLKIIRNRCAHSNHIISPKLRHTLSRIRLEQLDVSYAKFGNNFCKVLLFIFNNLIGQDKEEFKSLIYKLFYDYRTVIKKYNHTHTIDEGMYEKIHKYFI